MKISIKEGAYDFLHTHTHVHLQTFMYFYYFSHPCRALYLSCLYFFSPSASEKIKLTMLMHPLRPLKAILAQLQAAFVVPGGNGMQEGEDGESMQEGGEGGEGFRDADE